MLSKLAFYLGLAGFFGGAIIFGGAIADGHENGDPSMHWGEGIFISGVGCVSAAIASLLWESTHKHRVHAYVKMEQSHY
jgi:hypothetical protein